MKIFVTGATGFIGSYVAHALMQKGHQIVAFCRNPQKIPSWVNNPKISFVQGELQQTNLFAPALRGCEVCVHIALGWGDEPLTMLQNDTLPSVTLLQAAAENGCVQFIYTSSTAAMGQMRPVMDESVRCIPQDLYGATKSASESFVLGFGKSNMRRNIVRPGYTFGNPVVPDAFTQPDERFRKIARLALQNLPIELIKHDGTQFAWAGDLARLYVALVEGNCNEQVYLGLSNQWVSWEQVAKETCALCNSKSQIVLKDLGWGKDPIVFSVDKMQRELGISYQAYPALTEHIQWCISQAQQHL